ncbi:peptidase S8 [Marmoricola endophyticus]|uniref:Peptidase S8 n=1 Tax=Marmoricola endophyticus TaxID=2040280 RepID=A0A917BQ07_9ACTN|nr:hypothetical protein [Marmoricola endophyticus]GGF53413.1 peptidase S8 [Marmoricola endophyticus]
MTRKILAAAAAAGAAAILTAVAPAGPATAAPAPAATQAAQVQQQVTGKHAERLCAHAAKKTVASCYAEVLVNDSTDLAPRAAAPVSSAKTPAQIQSAYKLTGKKSGGRTVAIVDAYGYPNLERDLGVFRSQYGLSSCTKANGCLKVVNQTGGTSLPSTDVGWAGEQALDVDAVSAACPDCKIVVVQANSSSITDLGKATQTAAKQSGVAAISNSYGGGDLSDSQFGTYYNHPGIAVTASTGDDGYQGASYPASSSYVTAVGGTSLSASSSSRGWTESAWSGAGSGCSSSNAALSAASSYDTGCSKRAMADVSAAADPSAGGLSVYYPTSASSSTWGQIGGTSESAPIVAAVYALSGNTSGYANAKPYATPSGLFDVTTGSNGSCSPVQRCSAGSGYDGPTGLGTPNGTSAF